MADSIREALKRLLAVIKPKYTDLDEIVAVVRAMAAAHTALAAEPPAPAEPDTDAVLTVAAIIREVDGYNSLGAAALAEAILAHPNAASVFQPPAPAPAADGEREELASALEVTGSYEIPSYEQLRRAASLLREARPQPVPVAAPTPDDFRRWWRETGSDDSGPTPEMLLTANAWAEVWAARCAQPIALTP